MQIRNPKMSARDAAVEFAATNWPARRFIGEYLMLDGRLRFRLIDGVKWYVVVPIPGGWQITEIGGEP